jgi:tetratricopeptide (TPR) repeat protein
MDRDDTLRRAEKLLRQGRLDAAIAEYAKLVEDQPRDWATVNLLGDLYVRAGQVEQAAVQYTRIADHLAREGFVAKAAAVYKKIVKINPDDDTALLRAAQLSAQQGLAADARLQLQALFQQRVRRGNTTGAAEAAAAYAALDPSDPAGRSESGRMFADLGDVAGAAAQLRAAGETLAAAGRTAEAVRCWQAAVRYDPGDSASRTLLVNALVEAGEEETARDAAQTSEQWHAVASGFTRGGRDRDALDALERALAVNPDDLASRVQLARAAMAQQDLTRARDVLTPVADNADPMVQFALAEVQLRAGDFTSGRSALRRCLAGRDDLVAPCIDLACAIGPGSPEVGFAVAETVVRFAEAGGDTDLALDALERFLAVVPRHVGALEALIDVCGQTFYENQRYRAQVQLADAHLASGTFERARLLAEQLVAARPDDPAHVQRLAQALSGLGFGDADSEARARARRLTSPDNPVDFVSEQPAPSLLVEDLSAADTPEPPSPWADPAAGEAAVVIAPPERPAPAAADPARRQAPPEEPEEDRLQRRRQPVAEPSSAEREAFEIDLSGDLDDLLSAAPTPPRAEAERRSHPGGLEGFFEDLREGQGRDLQSLGAALSYDQASEHFNRGDVEAAAECLRTAARDPQFRFRAASMLARIARDRRQFSEAIDWLERAAEAPAPTVEASHGLLYELGDTLESSQEDARALAVFIELQASAPGYRDVADRIAQLVRRQAGPERPARGRP